MNPVTANCGKIKIGWLMLIAAAGLLVVFLVPGQEGLPALYGVHMRTRHLQKEITHLHHAVDSLNTEIRRLRDDTLYIERIAREKLGMARPDEKIFKFIHQEKENQ